ncbi:MAG: GTP-binding protein, partial [Anaerolineae bacterium]|nr:GTP-binding protein [Anaerolineae bacterium]
MKICAVGEEAVGKTSLIRRFVADKFSEEYIKTVGTHLSKKTVRLEDLDGGPIKVDAIIWDIMGQRSFSDLIQDAHFQGAKGVFAVCDITRTDTLGKLNGWLVKLFSTVGLVPVVIMANKWDLKTARQVRKEDMMRMSETYGSPYFLTSAKTGQNVPQAFEDLI